MMCCSLGKIIVVVKTSLINDCREICRLDICIVHFRVELKLNANFEVILNIHSRIFLTSKSKYAPCVNVTTF